MTTYEVRVILPEASLQELRSRVAAGQGLALIQEQLQAAIEEVSDRLGKALESAETGLKNLGYDYEEQLGSYLQDIEVRPHLAEKLKELLEYGYFGTSTYFEGADIYQFVDDFVEIEASFESEQFPRIAKCSAPRMWEYDPQTGEALLKTELYFDDDKSAGYDPEFDIYIKLKLTEEGPYSVLAEVH